MLTDAQRKQFEAMPMSITGKDFLTITRAVIMLKAAMREKKDIFRKQSPMEGMDNAIDLLKFLHLDQDLQEFGERMASTQLGPFTEGFKNFKEGQANDGH
jgi:hypothetical protein